MATEVGQDTLVFSGWITWEELVGVEVRELNILSDKKSQAPPTATTRAVAADEGVPGSGRGGGGCREFCLLLSANRNSK